MIRLVMDTNQLISGSLWPSGPAGFILEKWREHKIEIVVSLQILDELERVLISKLETGHETADYIKKVFAYYGILVDPKETINFTKK